MSFNSQFTFVALFTIGGFFALPALAENEGQDDLDQATVQKLSASSLSDLGEVIRLCESALQKGLDEDNSLLANQLLAATRISRGTTIAEGHLSNLPLDRDWPQYRRFALEDLEKGVELDAEQAQALFWIARLNALPGGDAERVNEALAEVIRLTEDDPMLRIKALIFRAGRQEDPQKQLADFDEAVRTNPGFAPAVRARASFHFNRQEFERSLADIDSIIKLQPEDASLQEDRARVLIELKRYDDAMQSLDEALQLDPESIGPLVQKARIHSLQSDSEKALDVLEQAHKKQPANPGLLLLRAGVYQELEQAEKALADVDQVLKLNPKSILAMRLRASLLVVLSQFDLAIAQLQELRKLMPDDLTFELQLGLCYSAEKRSRKAIEWFTSVIDKQPEDELAIVALRGRADALLGLGKQAEAIADYEKALELQPDDSGVLNNLSWVLSTSPNDELRNGKRAIELATKACELTEYKKAHILSTLASAHAETGDFDTARKWSEKAVETSNEDQLDALKKELESYRANKPWRELLSEPEPGEPESEESESGAPDAEGPPVPSPQP